MIAAPRVSSDLNLVILSPHLDDTVLSCGGWIHAARSTIERERVISLTLFAGTPNYNEIEAGTFIAHIHDHYGNPDDLIALRKLEDEAALAIVGASPVYTDLLDAGYRKSSGKPSYPSWPSMTTTMVDEDRALPDEIGRRISALFPAQQLQLHAPLGIGGHVDHRIVHEAGLRLIARGYDVLFFEDLPYVVSRGVPDAIARSGQWAPVVRAIDEADLDAKARAIVRYASQVSSVVVALTGAHLPPGVTGDETLELVRGAITRYATSVADGCQYAERLWRITS